MRGSVMMESSEECCGDTSSHNCRFDCPICLEGVNEEPVVTPCGHLFCWGCLYRWIHPRLSPQETMYLEVMVSSSSSATPGSTTTTATSSSKRAPPASVIPPSRLFHPQQPPSCSCPVCNMCFYVWNIIPIFVLQPQGKQPTSDGTTNSDNNATTPKQSETTMGSESTIRIPPRPQPFLYTAGSSTSDSRSNGSHSTATAFIPTTTSTSTPFLLPFSTFFGTTSDRNGTTATTDPNTNIRTPEDEFLSRLLLMLGSFVILCLLLF
jgi:hypothetical protein